MQEISWGIALQALLIAFQVLAFLTFLGYWPSRLLLAGETWSRYRLALAPFVGWLFAVTVSYYLNAIFLNMSAVFWLLVALGAAGNVAVLLLLGGERPRSGGRWMAGAALAGLILFAVAVAPHARGGSLGLLALNVDEELYFPYAEHIKHYPATMSGAADGPLLRLFESTNFKSRGQGFAYMLALASIVSRTPTFLAYMPLIYTMLGMSVASVYLFARAGLRLSERTAFLAAGLYALNGLPLWFSGMGFGPHTVAFALFPLSLAAIVVALREGGARSAVFAGWTSTVLISSYFWAISAVFLVAVAPLVLVLALARRGRLQRLKTLAVVAAAGVLGGFPGLFWVFKWALPILGTIATDLNGTFGNAWGDLKFPPLETSLGLRAYHMVSDPDGMVSLLGLGVWDTLTTLRPLAWLAFLGLAVLALFRTRGDRLAAAVLSASFGLFVFWVWKVAGYQYGHFKNLSYVSFFADTLLAAGLGVAWTGGLPLMGRMGRDPARPALAGAKIAAGAILAVVVALTGVNTVQTLRWYWKGFSWNMPAKVVEDARSLASRIPEGATVALSRSARYPLLPGSVIFRPITLAFHYESSAASSWTKRLVNILATELWGRNFFTAIGTTAFPGNAADSAPPEYLILGKLEDPRMHGLLRAENLLPGGEVGLYRPPGSLILDGDQIASALGGSNVQFGGKEFSATVDAAEVRARWEDTSGASGPVRRVMLGIVNAEAHDVDLTALEGSGRETGTLAPGLNWVVLEGAATPFGLRLVSPPESRVQVFVVRAFDPALGPPAGWTPDPHAVLAVTGASGGPHIRAEFSFINPAERGRNVGVTYQEPLTKGFWVSAVAMPSKFQRVVLEYDVAGRELDESINGTPLKTARAREAEGAGTRAFDIVFAHGDENAFRFALFQYEWRDGGVEAVRPATTPYVFDLLDR